MALQNDLTIERASALKLAKALTHAWFRKTDMFKNDAVIGFSKPEWDDLDKYIAEALQQTRQDALREAAEVAREFLWEQPTVHADPLRQARYRGNREAGQVLARELDRLASEGAVGASQAK